MSLNIEQFTDKAQATVQAAIQLAKDYANSQGTSIPIPHLNSERSLALILRMQSTPHTWVLCS